MLQKLIERSRRYDAFTTPMREFIYGHGCPVGREKMFKRIYEDRNQSVIDYFSNDSDGLLVLDLERVWAGMKFARFLAKLVRTENSPTRTQHACTITTR